MKLYQTRFYDSQGQRLAYTKIGKDWRFVFVSSDGTSDVVGPYYHSKLELLCDANRYATEFGFTNN